MTKEKKELIVVKQIPVIEAELQEISRQITKRLENVTKNLIANEDTKGDIKSLRTELRKEFDEYEEQRKMAKNIIMTPYNELEEKYKKYITIPYKESDELLKDKVDQVEEQQKKEKEKEAVKSFNNYIKENNKDKSLDFLTFEDLNLKITLASGATSSFYEKQIKEFVDNIISDLKTINSIDNSIEILIEYKKSFNLSQSINTVNERKEQVAQEQSKKTEIIQKPQVQKEPKSSKKEEVFIRVLTVKETKYKLESLRQFLDDNNYDYTIKKGE